MSINKYWACLYKRACAHILIPEPLLNELNLWLYLILAIDLLISGTFWMNSIGHRSPPCVGGNSVTYKLRLHTHPDSVRPIFITKQLLLAVRHITNILQQTAAAGVNGRLTLHTSCVSVVVSLLGEFVVDICLDKQLPLTWLKDCSGAGNTFNNGPLCTVLKIKFKDFGLILLVQKIDEWHIFLLVLKPSANTYWDQAGQ